MSRRTVFLPYQPKTILNKGKRADHWFWTRYSAYPYIGCQHGCAFCYSRELKYARHDDPDDFSYLIKVKENAPELLRKALTRLPVDVIFTGDYQPAERKFQLTRRMLEVCRDANFPVFVLSRSPLVTRDLDLLSELQAGARATAAFSIISTPDSRHDAAVSRLERLAPVSARRFAAMEKLAAAGITTGTCLMPVLPGLCDSDENLRNVVRWTAEHGGSFVLAGGLTLSDQQRSYFLQALAETGPEWLELYQRSYPAGSYGIAGGQWLKTARRVRAFCQEFGIPDRLPRPVMPGERRAVSKRVVEALANRAYTLELENAPQARVWAYRKAAWAVEDLEQDLGLVYRSLGAAGLSKIPGLDSALTGEVETLLRQLGASAPRQQFLDGRAVDGDEHSLHG